MLVKVPIKVYIELFGILLPALLQNIACGLPGEDGVLRLTQGTHSAELAHSGNWRILVMGKKDYAR